MVGSITTTPPVIELPPGSSPSSIAKGDTGAAGPANTLAIGTVTNGGAASATITGTAPAQTLNLVLPAGPTGPTGPTGPSGAVGASGTPTVNQFATWLNATTAQGVSITGLVKGNGASAPAAAVAGTDYLAPPSGTAIQKANSSGALANAVAGTDYIAPPAGTALLKANSGGALANATAGTDYIAPPAGTALLKANSGGALANATAGTDYMKLDTSSTLTAGFKATSFSIGTVTTGTTTPDAANGNMQHMTANGAFTLAPPSATCCIDIEVLNGASAGSITTSGFTKVNGDTYATTNALKFIFHIEKTQNYSRLSVEALQ